MRNAPQAIAAAKASKTNVPAKCQNWTWSLYQAHSVGDVDHDGDADAVDGWKSEPKKSRHTDRRPSIGAPVAFSGGSGGFGHRAIVIGYKNGEPLIRSTDAGGRGIVADRALSWFEKTWHLHYLGWSDTISGMPIRGLVPAPSTAPKAPVKKAAPTKGPVVDALLKDLNKAKAKPGTVRHEKLQKAKKALSEIPDLPRKA